MKDILGSTFAKKFYLGFLSRPSIFKCNWRGFHFLYLFSIGNLRIFLPLWFYRQIDHNIFDIWWLSCRWQGWGWQWRWNQQPRRPWQRGSCKWSRCLLWISARNWNRLYATRGHSWPPQGSGQRWAHFRIPWTLRVLCSAYYPTSATIRGQWPRLPFRRISRTNGVRYPES